jgi:hypothetical protein
MEKKFKKVIIWGHKLHTHTHSYIHYGFFKAFESMGYETHWLDNRDNTLGIDFTDTLFITEGQVDSGIPLVKDSYYVLHNTPSQRYREAGCKTLTIQVYTRDVPNRGRSENYYTVMEGNGIVDCLYMPWATDLLPQEIDLGNATNSQNRVSVWVGTIQENLGRFFNECRNNGVSVRTIDPWINPVSPEENISLIRDSYISPALQSNWQVQHGYIPCRIFKNISYGHFGYTNSDVVRDVFDGLVIYDADPGSLFHKAIEEKNSSDHIKRLKDLMSIVKEKHTYVSRIETILSCLP